MSGEPSTPQHTERLLNMLAQSSASSNAQAAAATRANHAIGAEPSPASTYGGSTANESVPVTPNDAALDRTSILPTSHISLLVTASSLHLSGFCPFNHSHSMAKVLNDATF